MALVLPDESRDRIGGTVWNILHNSAAAEGVSKHLIDLFVSDVFCSFKGSIFERVSCPATRACDDDFIIIVKDTFCLYATERAKKWAGIGHNTSPSWH